MIVPLFQPLAKLQISEPLEFTVFQIKRLSCTSNGKIYLFLDLISKFLPNKTSLSAALSFETETKCLELSDTSSANDNLIFHSRLFPSSVFIAIVPCPSIELLLLTALVIVHVKSLSVSIKNLHPYSYDLLLRS